MPIMFNGNQFGIVNVDEDETERRIHADAALGRIPQVIPRERFVKLTHSELEKLYGSYIEVNRDACADDEEYQKLLNGELLNRWSYEQKWRMWEGGFPTPEQIASAPPWLTEPYDPFRKNV